METISKFSCVYRDIMTRVVREEGEERKGRSSKRMERRERLGGWMGREERVKGDRGEMRIFMRVTGKV